MIKGMSRSEGEAVMKSRAAVTVSIFSLLLTIFMLISNSNSGGVLSITLEINDAWNFYQARSIKQDLYETANNQTTDASLRDSYRHNITKLEQDRLDLYNKTKKLEADREEFRNKSFWYSIAIAIMQISIVLSSTSILAVSMEMLLFSIASSVISTIVFAIGYF